MKSTGASRHVEDSAKTRDKAGYRFDSPHSSLTRVEYQLPACMGRGRTYDMSKPIDRPLNVRVQQAIYLLETCDTRLGSFTHGCSVRIQIYCNIKQLNEYVEYMCVI